ncbi:unnamed protein product [Adineta ricciae]|uniref:Uncharacterized protein n=1 Tax=Adineta ricciae TaxID=249248 RepID=A0A814X9J4_ADIRI|nr:unnamed protein product [Adineta ricciae]
MMTSRRLRWDPAKKVIIVIGDYQKHSEVNLIILAHKITQISCSDTANNDNDWNELYSNDCEDIIFSSKKSTAYDHIAITDLMFSYSLPNLECCLNPSSSGIVSCPSSADQNNGILWNFT